MRKTVVILSILILSLFMSACGSRERDQDIPTEDEAAAYAEKEMGIKGVRVLDVQDVRNGGAEYYEIDAVYSMTGDRGIEFTLLRSCDFDTLFGTGYHYNWWDDYSDTALEDYLREHALPEGVFFSEGPYGRSNYGASAYFGSERKTIWFEFASDKEYGYYLDILEPWLNDWVSFEKQYLAEGKAPRMRVAAYRPQDDTMNYSIQVYREFGYDKDSFHVLGEDGETYRWASFQKAMKTEYESQRKLKMK